MEPFDPGLPITLRDGNPTLLVAPFTVNRYGQTEAGNVLFEIESGTPFVGPQPWGYGEWGEGEEWAGWEPNMLHLRSATGDIVSIDSTHFAPSTRGAMARRMVRYTDTGSPELLLECGEDGSDWLRIYVDSDDTLMLWFSSGGALPQTLSSEQTIQPNRIYFVACEWQHTYMAMRIDGGDLLVGTRDVPTGTWGAGRLQLKAA